MLLQAFFSMPFGQYEFSKARFFSFKMPPCCSMTVSLSFQIKCTLPQQTTKPGNLYIVRKETLPFAPTMLPQLELCKKLGPHVLKTCCQDQAFCRLNKAINDTFGFLLTSQCFQKETIVCRCLNTPLSLVPPVW